MEFNNFIIKDKDEGRPRSGKSFNMACDICKEIVHPLDAHMGKIEGNLITAHIDCWNKTIETK